ncbi:MAG: MotA/TolQ/ExbB proton channel family protein [candidate division Zixibacteria bacterium]|nr:MotA/TolQ/ExbB proton channel family protein [candidate division Zixibacteria bacterium]
MQMIYDAGPLVLVLFFVSILTIGFALERFWALNVARGKVPYGKVFPRIKDSIAKGDLDGAERSAEGQLGSVGRVVTAGIKKYKALTGRLAERGLRNEMDLALREANVLEGALLERNIIPIATIGSIANLIGLLGTVMGMIKSFAALSATGAAEKVAATKLAEGIATALVNAAGGLIVAIMAVIFYNYFLNRIDNLVFSMEEASGNLLELCMLAERKRSSTT